jgi:hypothetical protein
MTDAAKPIHTQSTLNSDIHQELNGVEPNLTDSPSGVDDSSNAIDAELVSVENATNLTYCTSDVSMAEGFFAYYESFVERSIEDPLLWHSQTFGVNSEPPTAWRHPWVKVGLIGVGGLSTIAVTGSLLLKGAAQPTLTRDTNATLNQKNSATQSPRVSSSAVAPPASTMELSGGAPSPGITKVRIPKVISPAIRAPLPGQVISRQSIDLQSLSSPSAKLPNPKTSQRRAPNTRSVSPKNISTSTTIVARPIRSDSSSATPLPTLTPSAPEWVQGQLNSAHRTSNLRTGESAALTPKEPVYGLSSESILTSPSEATPRSQSNSKDLSPQLQLLRSAELDQPGTELGKATIPGSLAPGSKFPKAESLPLPPFTKLLLKDAQSALKLNEIKARVDVNRRNVTLGNVSPEISQSINAAQTIRHFLDVSKKLPKDLNIAVVPLTQQATTVIPRANELGDFQVFRLPMKDYENAWARFTQEAKQVVSVPEFGFIDYQQQVIVLPLT